MFADLAQTGGDSGTVLLGVAAVLTAVGTTAVGIYAARAKRSTSAKADSAAGTANRAETLVHDTVKASASAEGKASALTDVVNNLTLIITNQAREIASNSTRIDKCETERDHLREEVGDLRRMVHAGLWAAATQPAEPPPPLSSRPGGSRLPGPPPDPRIGDES